MSAESLPEFPAVRSPPSALGRPREYSDADAQAVLDSVAITGSLIRSCRELNIPLETVRDWKHRDASFSNALLRAREQSADVLVDEALSIVDDPAVADSHEKVGHAKLRSEMRKWMASKYRPQQYGDKLELAGDLTVSVVVKRFSPDAADAAIDVSPTVDNSVHK